MVCCCFVCNLQREIKMNLKDMEISYWTSFIITVNGYCLYQTWTPINSYYNKLIWYLKSNNTSVFIFTATTCILYWLKCIIPLFYKSRKSLILIRICDNNYSPPPKKFVKFDSLTMVWSFIVHVIYIRRNYLSLQMDIVP